MQSPSINQVFVGGLIESIEGREVDTQAGKRLILTVVLKVESQNGEQTFTNLVPLEVWNPTDELKAALQPYKQGGAYVSASGRLQGRKGDDRVFLNLSAFNSTIVVIPTTASAAPAQEASGF